MDSEKVKQRKRQRRGKTIPMLRGLQESFDRVKHDKLAKVMEKAGVPDLERRLIINLYWGKHVAVR